MKASWLVFFLFMAISASMAQAHQKKRVKISSDLRKAVDSALETLEKTHAQAQEPRKTLGQHKRDMVEIVEDLYRKGLVSLEQLDQFAKAVDEKSSSPLCSPNATNECGEGLKAFFNSFYEKQIKSKEPYCAQNFEVASVKQCCGDLQKLPYADFKPNKCEPAGKSCSSHGQCCSQFCNKNEEGAGTCSTVFSCYELKKAGQECPPRSPYCESDLFCLKVDHNSSGLGECQAQGNSCSANIDCCSDKCVSGKCVEKSLCLSCVRLGHEPKGEQECCPGTYKGLNGTCIQDFPPYGAPDSAQVEKKIFKFFAALLNFIIPSAVAAEDCSGIGEDGLTDEQRSGPGGYEECIQTVMSSNQTQEAISNALESCNEIKRGFFGDNGECRGEDFTRADYKDMYDMPNILSKTYSDFRKCEFKSHNDSWRSKNNMAKNAEIALQAFEVTYSGKGQDLITAGPGVSASTHPPSNGYSIFSRAKKIAIKLRRNRYELVNGFKELDIRMTCKCLAAFGPSKFGSEKKAFFNDKCEQEKKYVTEDFIRGEGGGTNDSDTATEFAQVDKGAVGLTHEKLLVEWLGLRRDLQLANFQNYESLEADMQALSDFVTNYIWIENPNTRAEPGAPIYRFKVKYLKALVGWVLGIASFIVIAGFVISTWGAGLVVVGAGLTAGLAAGMGVKALLTESAYDPKFQDVKIESESNQGWGFPHTHKYDTYDRYLVWPRTEGPNANSDMEGNRRCVVWAQANKCIQSVYLVNIQFDGFSVVNQPLLDVALPLTAPADAYLVEKTTSEKTYVKMLNDAYQNGRIYLQQNPDGSHNHSTHGLYWKKNDYEYSVNPFSTPEAIQAFLAERGAWEPPLFENHKDAFTDAVVKYALCKELVDCSPHSLVDLDAEKDIGFGYLFEKEDDAQAFSEYVYKMHLIWPRIAAGEKIAYPTLGLDAYFQSMAFNLRVAGSFALRNSLDTNELYELYKADYEVRKNNYNGLGGVEQGGESSQNVELSPAFFEAAQALSFQNGVSVEEFNSQLDNLTSSERFNPAEAAALRAIGRHSVRNERARERRRHFQATHGKTQRGKRKAAAASNFATRLNRPLENIDLHVGGQNLGRTASNPPGQDPAASRAKVKNGGEKNGKRSAKRQADPTFSSSYQQIPNNYSSGSGGSGGSGGSNISDSNSGSNASKLSEGEARVALAAAARDKSLEEVLPGDTLWTVVSKAYKRNLSRVLVLKSQNHNKKNQSEAPAKEDISNIQKSELKQLLKNEF